jgi:hypothetical protein
MAMPAVTDFRSKRHHHCAGHAQHHRNPDCGDYGGDRADGECHQHRHEVAAHEWPVLKKGDRKRHSRGAEQEMHELRPLEVGAIIRACECQKSRHQHYGEKNRIDERVSARGTGKLIGCEPSQERYCEPQKWRGGEIDP